MDVKIRHFVKLVILTVILAILWYFQLEATTFGIVKVNIETERNYIFNGQGQRNDCKHAKLQEQVYRQTHSTKFRSRLLLQYMPEENNFSAGKLLSLFNPGSANRTSQMLKSGASDADCSDVHNVPVANRCMFVNETTDCQIEQGFLDYNYFIYCDFGDKLVPLAVFILLLWWLFLFVGLAVTADDFFCPALSVISETLRLSHNIAGVTFLAFGNGAPDIFSAIAAVGSAKDGDAGLAIGALFGAGVFVSSFIAGTIAIIAPFDAMQRPFLRDIVFYIAALFYTFYILWDRNISKLEAIGFIVLYVLYVFVVVIGRYIYTRYRTTAPHHANIQTKSGVSHVLPNPVDIDESQPLLANSQIISMTEMHIDTPFHEFLHSINPIDREEFLGMNLFKKIYAVFKCPFMFVLIITIPVVNKEDVKHHWNRHLQCLQCVIGPLFCVLSTEVGTTMIGGSFPVWALTVILGVMFAAVVFFTSKNDEPPKYHAAFAFLSFLVAVIWIYSIANEIVNILQTFGVVMRISNALLGLTFLAWGNSIGDFIADTVMAKQGYPRMGISACFGGPLFNLLLGIGIPFTIATVRSGDYKLQITFEEVVLAAFLALSLVSSLIIVPASKFRMTRGWGIYLIILYVVFLVVAILAERKVIYAHIAEAT